MKNPKRPTSNVQLLVIVGPTATGKSDLAMKIAKEFSGEIICADSRTIYKGMDIGTGKPSRTDQKTIRHHLLDLVEVNEFFSAADFKEHAVRAIADIQKRNKLPILVGGSGLYIDSVLFDFEFLPPADMARRKQLNAMDIRGLQKELIDKNITLPLNYLNKRHLVRSLETNGAKPKKNKLRKDTLVIGMDVKSEDLKSLIIDRDQQMIKAGLETEVRTLTSKFGRSAVSLDAIGYREWQAYFDGNQTLQETKDLIVKNSISYARRQRTWFRRNPHIQWFDRSEVAYAYLTKLL